MDDLAEFRHLIRKLLAQYPPHAATHWEGQQRLPDELLPSLAEAGVFTRRWHRDDHQGVRFLAAMVEEASCLSAGLSIALVAHSEMFIGALTMLASTPAQHDLAVAAMAGRVTGCFAATESAGGSDLASIETTVAPCTGGTAGAWRLRGRKRYVSNAAQASHVLVLARTEGRPARDLTLVVVPCAAEGVELTGVLPTVGSKECPPGELSFDAVLPADAVLGTAGMGLVYASKLLQYERLAICVQLITAARHALLLATAFARQRPSGDGRLMDRQVIRHRLAWAQARLWPLQGQLGLLLDRMAEGRLATHELAGLKMVAAEACEQILADCMQVLGARGYTTNFPLERMWRDVRLARIGGGSEEVMAELVGGKLDRSDPPTEALLDHFIEHDAPVEGVPGTSRPSEG